MRQHSVAHVIKALDAMRYLVLFILLNLHSVVHVQGFACRSRLTHRQHWRSAADLSLQSLSTSDEPTAKETVAPSKRKPKNYWNDKENVRRELREFWQTLNVTAHYPQDRPPLPSFALLNHFGRNDLRQVMLKYGGREYLSEDLGGCEVIPGKWKVAVNESRIVQELVQNPVLGLRADLPPLSPQQKRTIGNSEFNEEKRAQTRWKYSVQGRRPIKYWSLAVLIESLYEYLSQVRLADNRPAVWMPRPAEIKQAGQNDLFQAIARFGGSAKVAKIAGVVPYTEWRYFEGQLKLMKDLTGYLDEFHRGDHTLFPIASEIKSNNYMALYYGIQRYGGCKFLLTRFGMVCPRGQKNYLDMSFGPFSIDFAIDLLEYIRDDHLKRQPPLNVAVIRMPTEYELFSNGRNDLIDCIQQFGGYENVARRLGLDYVAISTSRSSGGRRR